MRGPDYTASPRLLPFLPVGFIRGQADLVGPATGVVTRHDSEAILIQRPFPLACRIEDLSQIDVRPYDYPGRLKIPVQCLTKLIDRPNAVFRSCEANPKLEVRRRSPGLRLHFSFVAVTAVSRGILPGRNTQKERLKANHEQQPIHRDSHRTLLRFTRPDWNKRERTASASFR